MLIMRWLVLTILCLCINSEIHASSPQFPISEIPPSGMIITTPGTYVFENDITWTPAGDGQAIFIIGDNITLDLRNYKLESPYTQFNTIGIHALGCANLTIKHGTISHMALGGVKCEGCARVVIKHITVDGLNLQNTATYTVPVGILVSASVDALIHSCMVQNLDVKTASTAAIQLTGVLSSKVSSCHITNLINRDGACTGIGHLLCDTAEVKSCVLDNIQSEFIDNLNTEGHTAIGIIPVASTNINIERCEISNITGCCDDAHGISLFECTNGVIKRCKVKNVLDGAGPAQTGAKATGIEVYASNSKVIECYVKNITAINPQDKQATGFSVAQCTGVEFFRCEAENVNVYDQFGGQSASLGYGTGFGWAPDPRIVSPAVDVLYKYCTAKKCQVGFDSWYHINSVWENIYSDCNKIAILDKDQPPRTLTCDPCSECGCLIVGCYPTPFSITLDNVAQNNVFTHVFKRFCKK